MINLNKESALSRLRHRSKSWHQTIDQFGISHALKNNNIDGHQYQAWLCHNLSFAEYIINAAQVTPDKYSYYSKYLPDSQTTKSLRSDISDNYATHIRPLSITQSDIMIPALIPVYIYQGSVMGKNMIRSYLIKQKSEFSMNYINHATDKVLMKEFLQEAAISSSNLNHEQFNKAIDLMWDSIIENYRFYTTLT